MAAMDLRSDTKMRLITVSVVVFVLVSLIGKPNYSTCALETRSFRVTLVVGAG